MNWLRIIVGSINAVVLLAGVAIWLAGWIAQNPSCKRVGVVGLEVWLLVDLIGFILAFRLGWFA